MPLDAKLCLQLEDESPLVGFLRLFLGSSNGEATYISIMVWYQTFDCQVGVTNNVLSV